MTAACPFGNTEEKSAWQPAQLSDGVCELDGFAKAAGLNTRHSNAAVIRDADSILALLIPATV